MGHTTLHYALRSATSRTVSRAAQVGSGEGGQQWVKSMMSFEQEARRTCSKDLEVRLSAAGGAGGHFITEMCTRAAESFTGF